MNHGGREGGVGGGREEGGGRREEEGRGGGGEGGGRRRRGEGYSHESWSVSMERVSLCYSTVALRCLVFMLFLKGAVLTVGTLAMV